MIKSNSTLCIENELIESIQNNQQNQADITKLYKLFTPFIKAVIIKTSFYPSEIDTEELSHVIFTKIFYQIDKFNTEKNPYPFIKTITRNFFIDLHRKNKNIIIESLETVQKSGPLFNSKSERFLEDNPEQIIVRKERHLELYKVLDSLERHNRELIEGFYFEEKSINELADENNISNNSVSVKLLRIRAQMKNIYEKMEKKCGEMPYFIAK